MARTTTPEASADGNMLRFEALIFATGAATLSLEVLASRIMTPYFGVSLYIWAGILSITLTFLAVGYYLGGRLSERLGSEGLEALLLAAPALSALSIALSVAVYPVLFPLLSSADLVFGSFAGGFLLLALPLTALSAMNPVLIALQRHRRTRGDGGAGRIFFISTVGSVAGVLVTAFVFIPNITNYRASLLLGIALCAAVALLAFRSLALTRARRIGVYGGCAAVMVLCGALLLGQERYLAAISGADDGPVEVSVRAEYTSMFGNVKVVQLQPRDGRGIPMLAYVQDGLLQNRTTLDGVSLSLYTHVLESLTHAFAAEARAAVVLGLGAGIVPRDLKDDGLRVDVVEINPDSLRAATEYFRFDPQEISVRLEDARTFVRRCRQEYDVAILDLFQGDGTPDYLLSVQFFRDVKACLRAGGAVVMNVFLDDRNDAPNRRLLATVAAAFPDVVTFRSPVGNAFIVATTGPFERTIRADVRKVPAHLRGVLRRTLASGRRVAPRELAGVPPVTDEQNVFSVLFADTQIRLRRSAAGMFPPQVLVN
jgi:predicted membrane-bound spermidine synthase